ncbi:type VI secretion system Vgr family protein, partial [Janthinobacterium sp. CG_S6]|uniref:type VI secretion system Vgr family protein n=1 Tax=Janthinobacterium sp. CG_S6 TaxID=3071707 RepID=UPI002DFB4BD6|nr:Rhs element Vgr protein [Janthinobacterium sp. CG_S6]
MPQSSSLQALLAGFTQSTRLLQLTTPLGPDKLLVECLRGEEGLSQGYSLKVAALSSDARIPLKSLIGQPARVDLLTGAAGARRPFHGHITAVEMTAANGGFARYALTIEPWTAFLALNQDSRIFQDMTVCDILDAVFAPYLGQGRLMPAWRFDIAERDIYPRRSLTTQYQESDLAFILRLMSEEGLFYYYEHSAGDGPGLGGHTLVVADHNGSFQANVQADIAFTQPGAVMKADSLDRWRTTLTQRTNAIELSSWDYRSCRDNPVG